MPLEQDKSGGFKLNLDAEMNTGMWPENFATKIPLWEDSFNVIFTELGVQKVRGSTELVSTGLGDPIRGLVQVVENEDAVAYMGDLTQLYRVNMTDQTFTVEGTGYNMAEDAGSSLWDGGTSLWDGGSTVWDAGIIQADQWSIINYGTFILATNGEDLPQINKQDLNGFVPVTGMDVTSVEIWVKRGPHVLGFNTSTASNEFVWCDADDVDTWVAAPDNLAGQLEIRELKTAIKAAVPLGGRIAVYGEDQMFVVNYLANDLVFGYQPAVNGIGAVSKHAVVPVGRMNYGLSQQGFFVTDGSQFDYIDDPQIRQWFNKNANVGQLSKVSAYHDEENNAVRWYFPFLQPANTNCVAYNYVQKNWSFIEGDRSAGDERRVMSSPIVGTETGKLLQEGVGHNNQGTAITAYATTKAMDLGNPDLVKELNSMRLGFKGTGLKFKIGWAETEDGTVNWESETNVLAGYDFMNLRTAGRWLFIEIFSDQLNDEWSAESLQLIGRAEGTR